MADLILAFLVFWMGWFMCSVDINIQCSSDGKYKDIWFGITVVELTCAKVKKP